MPANGQHTVEGVAKGEVGRVVQSFINNDGAKRVDARERADGKWDVTAYT